MIFSIISVSKYIYLKNKNTKITFTYSGSIRPPVTYERFVTKIIKLVKKIYVLPETIQVQLCDLDDSLYGMTVLDPRFPNRIKLNQILDINDVMIPLIHELMHLHQIYTNKLQSRKGGIILWENQVYKVNMLNMSYAEYQNLPWEIDADQKVKKIIDFIKKT